MKLPLRALAGAPVLALCGIVASAASIAKRLIIGETIEQRLRRCYPEGHFVSRWEDLPNYKEPT